MHTAASNDATEAIVVLVKVGANVNANNKDGTTPLQYAIYTNSQKAITTLIDAGADVNMKGLNSEPPLLYAVKGIVDGSLCGAIDKIPANTRTSLEITEAKKTIAAIVGVLVDAGAEVNTRDTNDLTALHHAAFFNTLAGTEISWILIRAGADVNAKTTSAKFAAIRRYTLPLKGTLVRLPKHLLMQVPM